MNCVKCQKELVEDEEVVEILRGEVEGLGTPFIGASVNPIKTMVVLCKTCGDEVLPALWADIEVDQRVYKP